MPHGGGRGGGTPNQNRLRAYELLENSEQGNQLARERFDFQQQKAAFEQAYKLSESERKTQEFQQGFEQRGEHISMLNDSLKLKDEIRQNDEILRQQQQLVKDRATVARQNAAKEFYGGVSKLNPQSPDFQKDFSDLMGGVQSKLVDSDGKLPEDVIKVTDHLWQQNTAWNATQTKAAQPTDPLKMAAQIRGQIGTYEAQLREHDKTIATAEKDSDWLTKTTGSFKDKDGQMYFGNSSPDDKAQNLTRVTPQTQRQYDEYQAALNGRADLQKKIPQLNGQLDQILSGNAPTPAPTAPVSAPAAAPAQTAPAANPAAAGTPPPQQAAQPPQIPAGHIAYLLAHPERAPDFDAKYGQGSSAGYLKPPDTAAAAQ